MSDPKKAWNALFTADAEPVDQNRVRREAKLAQKKKLAKKRRRRARSVFVKVSGVPAGSTVTVTVVTPPARPPHTCPKKQAEDFENCERWWAYTRPRRLPG